jgi:hypothetical protein
MHLLFEILLDKVLDELLLALDSQYMKIDEMDE